jgi:hypothetical protein
MLFITLVIVIVLIIVLLEYYILLEPQLDSCFYNAMQVEPKLYSVYNYNLISDIKCIHNEIWKDWPEKELYNENMMSWKILPFYGFGKWIETYCRLCPNIFNFLKNIPTLKTASLSKLSGGTKLTPHRGWGNLSNNVIRCHFGITVPDTCYISVKNSEEEPEEIRIQKQNEWLLFDDSKIHYAHNTSNKDRIVLLLDIERPKFIKKGTSTVTDTSELKHIIDYFHKL